MKLNLPSVLTITALVVSFAWGQGTFVYDQQSADENNPEGSGTGIQSIQPMGQSFTPTLSSMDFIRLYLYDGNPGNLLGATVYLNLRTDSIAGPVLATSDSVTMPNGFGGYENLYFSSSVAVTAGTIYYFQPVVESGDLQGWGTLSGHYGYSGGTAFANGTASTYYDLWFREGVVVPEPSSAALILVGGGALILFRCLKKTSALG